METIKITCRALLSDLDGTLIDSTYCVDQAWETWAKNHLLDIEWVKKNAHGMRTADSLKLLVPHLDLESEIKLLENLECACIENLSSVTGAAELLQSLAPGHWAIVTSGSSRLANHRLGHVGLPRPTVFVTADDVTTGKPEPHCYLLAAQSLGVEPRHCVVLEDSPAGIRAGKAAGAMVIAVSVNSADHDLSQADYVVHDLSKLKAQCAPDGLITISLTTTD
jgi:sugar-phosphatase